jgi:hypothetical protein
MSMGILPEFFLSRTLVADTRMLGEFRGQIIVK